MIEPRVLKGFRDSLPHQEISRRTAMASLAETFESFGFVPIDTPVLEYREVLLGKGGGETDKQVYSFMDHGGRDVAMRFDLTVPFARYMAAHVHELTLPFKRYHIDKVWRGENTQKGRYREFYQCDFDIVGLDHGSADFEILLMIHTALKQIGIPEFHIHISHRGVFNSLLETMGIASLGVEILRIIDKVKKIGTDAVRDLLRECISLQQASQILDVIGISGTPQEVLEQLSLSIGKEDEHILRLKQIIEYADASGIINSLVCNPSITRGLDYYTGVVYETFLDQLPGIGSICSGGRYNDLASLYTKHHLPGVGASIGLDRLTAALEELEVSPVRESTSQVLVCCMNELHMGQYQFIASMLRKEGINTEVFLTKKKMQQQFSYAEKRSIPLALILGDEELSRGTYSLKDIRKRKQHTFQDLSSLTAGAKDLLGGVHG